jgi:hypothetical protein
LKTFKISFQDTFYSQIHFHTKVNALFILQKVYII